MTHLRWLEREVQPRIAVSENVTTGNIGQRICEVLNESMDSQVPCPNKWQADRPAEVFL